MFINIPKLLLLNSEILGKKKKGKFEQINKLLSFEIFIVIIMKNKSALFKKTCYLCGEKDDKLYEGMCEKCLQEEVPPIYEIKPIAFKIDNVTKEICYNDSYYTFEEIVELLPNIVKNYVVINEPYILKELEVLNVELDGHTLSFDVEVDCDIK